MEDVKTNPDPNFLFIHLFIYAFVYVFISLFNKFLSSIVSGADLGTSNTTGTRWCPCPHISCFTSEQQAGKKQVNKKNNYRSQCVLRDLCCDRE